MSNVSLLKNIPDFLSQPAGIAALASIGIHGVIAFFLPLMPIDSKPKESTSSKSKTVGLLELNSADRDRLPQTTPQASAKLPVPLQPPSIQPLPPSNLTALTPVPSLPPASSQVTLPPLPQAPLNPSISSFPKGQSLRILPKINPSLNTNTATATTNRTTIAPSLPTIKEDSAVKFEPSKPLGTSTPPNLPREVMEQPKLPKRSNLPELQAGVMPSELPNSPSSVQTPAIPPAYYTPPSTVNVTNVPTQNQQLLTPQASNKLTLNGETLRSTQGRSISGGVPELPSTAVGTETNVAIAPRTSSIDQQWNQAKLLYPGIERQGRISETVISEQGQKLTLKGSLIVGSNGAETPEFIDSVTPKQREEVKQYLRKYFENHPAQANGKPKFYPFKLSFAPNSNNTAEIIKQPSLSSQTDKTQASSNSQEIITPRLRPNQVNLLPSNNVPANVRGLNSPSVTPQSVQQNQNLSEKQQAANLKPLPEFRIRNQSTLAPQQATAKPIAEVLGRKNDSSTAAPQQQATTKPIAEVLGRKNESSTATPQEQVIIQPSARRTESTPATQEQTTNKPLAERIKTNQSTLATQEQPTEKPSSNSVISSNLPLSPSAKQKLIKQLRELREQRQTTEPEK